MQPQVRLDSKAWEAGFRAGEKGLASTPPQGLDGLSWISGYIEGKAKRQGFDSKHSTVSSPRD